MKKISDELKEKLARQINNLKSTTSSKIGKYTRNLRVYTNTPYASLQSIEKPTILGFYDIETRESGMFNQSQSSTPNMNVVKSIIDTIVSKVSNSKPRPFINTINGTYKDLLVVRQAQNFFDSYFDTEKVHKKATIALQNACIFDTGYIYIDEETSHIESALPHQVFLNAAEMTYGNPQQLYYERHSYPTTLLPDYLDYDKNKDYVTYGLYYSLKDKIKVYVIDNKIIYHKPFNKECLPIVSISYTNPIIGESTLGICDILNGIQLEINQLMSKIAEASKLTPANTIVVPDDSNIKVGQLNNKIGQCIQYRPSPNGAAPITVATPTFIAPQYWQLLSDLIEKSYNLVGISQLDAQSVKPAGLDSGVALSTLEDITSDRFDIILQQFVHLFTDIAIATTKLFDGNDTILPKDNYNTNIKWKDIISIGKKMKIQYSVADSLSKDPSEKLKQLQFFADNGIIPKTRIASLMEIPDLEQGMSISNNALNAVMMEIQNCIEEDDYSIPDFIPIPLLKTEIINTLLTLKATNNKQNDEAIQKLYKLFQECVAKDNTLLGPDEVNVDENGTPISDLEVIDSANAMIEAQEVPETPTQVPEAVIPGAEAQMLPAEQTNW